MANKFTVTDQKVKSCLLDIMAAMSGENYNYYQDYSVTSVATGDRSKIKVGLKVVVPQAQRVTAATRIGQQLQQKYNVEYARDDTQLNVKIGRKEPHSNQVIRIDVKPMGGGSGAGSDATAINESAQCLYAALVFNVYHAPIEGDGGSISLEDFEEAAQSCEVDVKFDEMIALPTSWKLSSIRGANKLYDAIGKNKPKGYYKFYRGKGLDDGQIKNAYKKISKGTPFTSEDKWNPADIWIAASNFNANDITAAASSGLAKNINQFLIEKYDSKELIGVSLKKITSPTARLSLKNYTEDGKAAGVHYAGYELKYKTRDEYSIDVYIKYGSGDEKIQFRNFGGNKGGSWQGEVKGSSANQGKIGGGEVFNILKAFKTIPTLPNNQQEWADAGSNTKIAKISEEIYDKLKQYNAEGISPNKQATVGQISTFNKSYRYSKKLGLMLIHALETNKDKADEIVKDIYLYASSQHKLSGLYLKME
jgi:hypothetical protein